MFWPTFRFARPEPQPQPIRVCIMQPLRQPFIRVEAWPQDEAANDEARDG